MSKVRIYDLAKELRLESRKILEDARRFGAMVSAPSSSVDAAVAEKIREMYYPKKQIERFSDYKVGDVIEAFANEKVAPTQL
jgi:hypothetical protein